QPSHQLAALRFRYALEQLIDALHQLHIVIETVDKRAVEEVAEHLAEGRALDGAGGRGITEAMAAGGNHQHPAGIEVQCRAHRRQLAQGAVAVVVLANALWWKQRWQRA